MFLKSYWHNSAHRTETNDVAAIHTTHCIMYLSELNSANKAALKCRSMDCPNRADPLIPNIRCRLVTVFWVPATPPEFQGCPPL
eukprot:6172315-Pleurochrysis_carterae.AAC.1